MDNRNTVTIDGRTMPVSEYVDRQTGKEIGAAMSDYHKSFTKFRKGAGHSLGLADFVSIGDMKKDFSYSKVYQIIYYLLTHNGKEFTSRDIANNLNQDPRKFSFHTSKFKQYCVGSGEMDDIIKISRRNKDTVFKCIVESIDNPKHWANKYTESYYEFDRIRIAIKKEEKNKNKTVKRESKFEVKKIVPESALTIPEKKTEVLKPLTQIENNAPIDIPINIKISVSIDLKKDQ